MPRVGCGCTCRGCRFYLDTGVWMPCYVRAQEFEARPALAPVIVFQPSLQAEKRERHLELQYRTLVGMQGAESQEAATATQRFEEGAAAVHAPAPPLATARALVPLESALIGASVGAAAAPAPEVAKGMLAVMGSTGTTSATGATAAGSQHISAHSTGGGVVGALELEVTWEGVDGATGAPEPGMKVVRKHQSQCVFCGSKVAHEAAALDGMGEDWAARHMCLPKNERWLEQVEQYRERQQQQQRQGPQPGAAVGPQQQRLNARKALGGKHGHFAKAVAAYTHRQAVAGSAGSTEAAAPPAHTAAAAASGEGVPHAGKPHMSRAAARKARAAAVIPPDKLPPPTWLSARTPHETVEVMEALQRVANAAVRSQHLPRMVGSVPPPVLLAAALIAEEMVEEGAAAAMR